MFQSVATKAGMKAIALREALEGRLERVLQAWLLLAGLASALRIALSPTPHAMAPFELLSPYFLLVFAPATSLVLALRWFEKGEDIRPPALRFARIGRWREVSKAEAARHPLYGPNGLMVSLLIGILLNVPVRALEYLAAMPALAGDMPPWLAVLRTMLTIDVVLVSSAYVVTFVAALRRVPYFPRMLACVWLLDLSMQALTAQFVAAEPGLPVKVAGALGSLLEGNVDKVMISAGLWLPYLLLSKRVNVTYRRRVPA